MPGKFMMRFQCKRLSTEDMPWKNRDCVFIYMTYDRQLAFVGRAASDGMTVGSFWSLHELESHPVTRQIIRAFGGIMGMAVYAITPARAFPDISREDALKQVESVLIQAYEPPGNRSTTNYGMAEASKLKPRADLMIHIDDWPLSDSGTLEL